MIWGGRPRGKSRKKSRRPFSRKKINLKRPSTGKNKSIFDLVNPLCFQTRDCFSLQALYHKRYLIDHLMLTGRMQSGTCISDNFGYIGPSCSSDVLTQMDALCSGRRECSVEIKDSTFPGYRPCHKDLKSYLEASFTCLQGTVIY